VSRGVFAGGDLVGLLWDDHGDPAGVQGAPIGAGGVRLVRDHGVGAGARAAGADPGHADVGQGLATRYDKLAITYRAAVILAACLTWSRI